MTDPQPSLPSAEEFAYECLRPGTQQRDIAEWIRQRDRAVADRMRCWVIEQITQIVKRRAASHVEHGHGVEIQWAEQGVAVALTQALQALDLDVLLDEGREESDGSA